MLKLFSSKKDAPSHKESKLLNTIVKQLGSSGRMISGSKSSYMRGPGNCHLVFFNACIFDKNFNQIWFGDIDLDKDQKTLQEIALITNQTFYVTTEYNFRWEGLDKNIIKRMRKNDPSLKNQIRVFKPRP